jgi:hypothetical protein
MTLWALMKSMSFEHILRRKCGRCYGVLTSASDKKSKAMRQRNYTSNKDVALVMAWDNITLVAYISNNNHIGYNNGNALRTRGTIPSQYEYMIHDL